MRIVRKPWALFLCAAGVIVAPVAREGTARAQVAEEPGPDVEGEGQADEADGDAYADTDPSALTDFREALDPHGTWVDDPVYGTIWVPNGDEVGSDFEPYVTGGRWAYDVDYVWVSDFAWGWVAFHYGRWAHLGSGLWGWVPGRRYAGGWVDWRVGNDQDPYVGWSPRGPRWVWRNGMPAVLAVRARPLFVFCPRVDVFAPSVASRVVRGPTAAQIVTRTRAYVPAQPQIIARPVAEPQSVSPSVVRGPPPSALGIAMERVVAPNPVDPNVTRARAFARASTAAPLGGHAPVGRASRASAVQPAPRGHQPAPQPAGNRRR
jgi:hypothetical protein